MKYLIIILLLLPGQLAAQHNVVHFSTWNTVKPAFENGYKNHLKWHKENGETWSWYGWYIISGPRQDQFVDATFNHNWDDFGHSINPAGDNADNQLHTLPFGIYAGGYKMIGHANDTILRSKFLHAITINVTNIDDLVNKYNALSFKMADGGNLHQQLILVGFNTWQEFEKIICFQSELLKNKSITSITAETWLYQPDMSLLF